MSAREIIAEIGATFGSIASRTVNAVLFRGSMHQTLSARAYIEGAVSSKWARRRDRIDALFFWQSDHCQSAWSAEVDRARRTLAKNTRVEPDNPT